MILYYGKTPIAQIKETDRDFPTLSGSFQLLDEFEESREMKLKEYIDYSIEVWPFIEEDRIDSVDWSETEKVFSDLIESPHWWMRRGDTFIPILIPIFCTRGRINWRFDPDRENKTQNK